MSTPNATSKRRVLFDLYGQATPAGKRVACCFCGRLLSLQGATIEHVVPRSKGGKHESGNLLLSCHRCNHQRGAEEFGAFRARMVQAKVQRGMA